jgi:hypothetical protein
LGMGTPNEGKGSFREGTRDSREEAVFCGEACR